MRLDAGTALIAVDALDLRAAARPPAPASPPAAPVQSRFRA
jgi:hypothetical protein